MFFFLFSFFPKIFIFFFVFVFFFKIIFVDLFFNIELVENLVFFFQNYLYLFFLIFS
jgi:hypothetical protein